VAGYASSFPLSFCASFESDLRKVVVYDTLWFAVATDGIGPRSYEYGISLNAEAALEWIKAIITFR
jgi:hypothetical protein